MLFGTDGIRGTFGEPPMVPATARALGRALASPRWGSGGDSRPVEVVVGGDTRQSTPLLAAALLAGLESAGGRARWLGVVPTPAVAYVTRALDASAGVVLSASHNPWRDNGIKVLRGDGFKLSAAEEAELERALRQSTEESDDSVPDPAPEDLPPVDEDAAHRYRRHLHRLLAPGALEGLRVVLDCANGAASPFAADLFRGAGAAVEVIAAEPDGRNINRDCGSTAPAPVGARVVAEGADLGIAFDGDADRALLVDSRGEVRDGDEMLYLWARSLHEAGRLDPPRIVATSMSNLGLERALEPLGIEVVRCDVGDRHVVETLRRDGLRLGGEQSGHLVDLAHATTGDGLLTGLRLAHLCARADRPLHELLEPFRRFPQELRSIPVSERRPFSEVPAVERARAAVEEELRGRGRLVLRYSGTERLARIMVEAPDAAEVHRHVERLAEAITGSLGDRSG